MGMLCPCWLVTTLPRVQHEGNGCHMAPSGPRLASVEFHRNVQVREIKDILLAWLRESVSYNGSYLEGAEGRVD